MRRAPAIVVFALVCSSRADADVRLGPVFDFDKPSADAPAWGTQSGVLVASSRTGTSMLVWSESDTSLMLDWPNARLTTGAIYPPSPASPIPLGRLSVGHLRDVAWAGKGFVLATVNDTAVAVIRIAPDGTVLDAVPRLVAPQTYAPTRIDLDCDAAGRCLLLWSARSYQAGSIEGPLQLAAFGWDDPPETVANVTTVATHDADAQLPAGVLAHSGDTFLVAFSRRYPSGGVHAPRKYFTRRVSSAGALVGDTNELPIVDPDAPPQLARLDDRYLIVWRNTFDRNTYAMRVDAQGAALGSVLAVGSLPPVAISDEDAAVVFFQWSNGMVTRRIDRDGNMTTQPLSFDDGDLPELAFEPRGIEAAAFDGQAHRVVGAESVRGSWLDTHVWSARVTPGAAKHRWSLASVAANSLSSLRTAARAKPADGEAAAVAIFDDNRGGISDVGALAFDASGCPSRPVQPVFARDGHESASAVSADDDGFLVLGAANKNGSTLTLIRRLDRAGAALGDFRQIDGVAWPGQIHANIGGGFTVVGDTLITLLDRNARATTVPKPVDSSWSSPGPIGVAIDGGIAYVTAEGWDEMGFGPYDSKLRIRFIDVNGKDLRAPIVEPGVDKSGGLDAVFTTRHGYVASWYDGSYRSAPVRRAGLLTRDGRWSGLVKLDIPKDAAAVDAGFENDGILVADVVANGEELAFLLVRGRYYGRRGKLWLLRTTTAFETLSLTPLELEATAIETSSTALRLGGLVAGISAPTLITERYSVLPRNVRLEGRRLDGTQCKPKPPIAEPMPDAGDPALDGSVAAEAATADGGGCACRTSYASTGTAFSAIVVPLATFVIRRRRRRR